MKEASAEQRHKKPSQNTDTANQKITLWSEVSVSAKEEFTKNQKKKENLG